MSGFTVGRDAASAPYFDASASGRLLIKRCPVCRGWYPPQARLCPSGHSLAWQDASGDAVLITWAVDHLPPLAAELAAPDGHTSVFGLVELAEGPWLQVAVVGMSPEDLREGSPMRVRFVRPSGGEAIAAFGPPESANRAESHGVHGSHHDRGDLRSSEPGLLPDDRTPGSTPLS